MSGMSTVTVWRVDVAYPCSLLGFLLFLLLYSPALAFFLCQAYVSYPPAAKGAYSRTSNSYSSLSSPSSSSGSSTGSAGRLFDMFTSASKLVTGFPLVVRGWVTVRGESELPAEGVTGVESRGWEEVRGRGRERCSA